MSTETKCHTRIESVDEITVIRLVFIKGLGTDSDPIRQVTQLWYQGATLAEIDRAKI